MKTIKFCLALAMMGCGREIVEINAELVPNAFDPVDQINFDMVDQGIVATVPVDIGLSIQATGPGRPQYQSGELNTRSLEMTLCAPAGYTVATDQMTLTVVGDVDGEFIVDIDNDLNLSGMFCDLYKGRAYISTARVHRGQLLFAVNGIKTAKRHCNVVTIRCDLPIVASNNMFAIKIGSETDVLAHRTDTGAPLTAANIYLGPHDAGVNRQLADRITILAPEPINNSVDPNNPCTWTTASGDSTVAWMERASNFEASYMNDVSAGITLPLIPFTFLVHACESVDFDGELIAFNHVDGNHGLIAADGTGVFHNAHFVAGMSEPQLTFGSWELSNLTADHAELDMRGAGHLYLDTGTVTRIDVAFNVPVVDVAADPPVDTTYAVSLEIAYFSQNGVPVTSDRVQFVGPTTRQLHVFHPTN